MCRRCEERGSECTAQTFTALASDARRLTSRQKIHQLESKVAHLSKAVHNIEVKLGAQPAQTTGSATHPLSGSVVDDSVVDDYDDDSSASDVLGEDRPTLLSALFQNEWLSVDLQRRNEQLQDRKARTSAHLLDTAKQALQKLIPSKEDVESIAINGYASRWLVLVHTLFPQPFMVKTHQEMVSSYDDMQAPKVEPMALASWLLAVALTAVQVPQEKGSPGAQLNLFQRASYFARAIAETVEKMILSHDRLIGTIQGLSLALLCGRL